MVLQGKKVVFMTNNSSKSRAQYLKKFTGFNIDANEVCRFVQAVSRGYILNTLGLLF